MRQPVESGLECDSLPAEVSPGIKFPAAVAVDSNPEHRFRTEKLSQVSVSGPGKCVDAEHRSPTEIEVKNLEQLH